MKIKKLTNFINLGASIFLASTAYARVDNGWTNNVPADWLDDTNWTTGYAAGGSNDPTPEATYAYLAGAHVDVTLSDAIKPISILGMYDDAKLLIKNTRLEIDGEENIVNVWKGSVLTLDNATLKTFKKAIDLQTGGKIIAKNSSMLQLMGSNNYINGGTILLQSGSTIDANGAGDIYFTSGATRSDFIIEGAGAGIVNYAKNSNRGLWTGGGNMYITFKNGASFDGVMANVSATSNGGFIFDNAKYSFAANNGNFIYDRINIAEGAIYEHTFKNGSIANANNKSIDAGISAGSGGTWQLNLLSGSKLDLGGGQINLSLSADNSKMQINVKGGSIITGSGFSLGHNIVGQNSTIEVNIEGVDSKIDVTDLNVGSTDGSLQNTIINLMNVDNGALNVKSAICLNAGAEVNIQLANRNAMSEGATGSIISATHVGDTFSPIFTIDFSKLTLNEGYYDFQIFSYKGDYHPETTDLKFDFILGGDSGFSDADVLFQGGAWWVSAYTSGLVPEPSTYAAILGALALAFTSYRKRK